MQPIQRVPLTDEQRQADDLRQRNQAAMVLLNSWDTDDPDEITDQRETWEAIKRSLDHDPIRVERDQ